MHIGVEQSLYKNDLLLLVSVLLFQEDGFKVWLDVDQIKGSTLEAMADGVENAAIVLLCMTEKYKLSPNCRTGNYTFYVVNI